MFIKWKQTQARKKRTGSQFGIESCLGFFTGFSPQDTSCVQGQLFFSGPKLFQDLFNDGLCAFGTCCPNRLGLPDQPAQEKKKVPVDSYRKVILSQPSGV